MAEDFNVTQLPPDLVAEGQLPMAPSALAQLQEPVAQAQQPQALDQPPDQGTPSRGEMMQQPAQPPPRVPGTSSLGSYQGTKGQIFRNMLGDFLYSAGKGLAEAGHGPGANARGAGVAMTSLYDRGIQQQQMAMREQAVQQAGELQRQQAEYITPSIDMVGPDGTTHKIAPKDVPSALGAQYRFAGQMGSTAMKVGSAEKINTEKMQTELKKTAMTEGQSIPVDETVANLAGIPELADKPVGKATWDNIKKSLDAKGYKLADLGKEGAWIIDRGGNKIKRVGESPSIARGMGYALGRAIYTPFETVEPGTNTPTTISNLQAIQTGAPKVSLPTQAKLGGQYALFNDAYGILDTVSQLGDKVNLDNKAVASRVAAGYAAIKDPAAGGLTGEVLKNILLNQPINNQLSDDERQLVLTMAQGKAAGTGLRGIMGQAGTNEYQQHLDSALMPGPQGAASKKALKSQVDATRALLDRFVVGQPNVGLNAPGTPTALGKKTGGGGGSAPPISMLKEGFKTHFDNGQDWTLKNGKAVEVTGKP